VSATPDTAVRPVAAAVPRPRKRAGRRRPVRKALLVAGAVIASFLWLLPVLLVVSDSLKNPQQLFSPSGLISLPTSPDFGNYAAAWTTGTLGSYMRNSAIITLIKVPVAITLEAGLAYYLVIRGKSRIANWVFGFVIVGMIFPPQAALVPLHNLLQTLHIFNTWSGLILVYIGFGLPFGTLLLRSFFRTVPPELAEAARIDGAGALPVFLKIYLPMSWPAIAALAIFDTVWTWNEFLFAQLFITSDSLRPVQAGLMQLNGKYSEDFMLLSAGVVLSIIPVVIVYVVFQRKFVTGLAGALKG
jgi:raffinose/stachyose/melibiose transport system permease protein